MQKEFNKDPYKLSSIIFWLKRRRARKPTTLKKQQNFYSKAPITPIMETITLPKSELEQLHKELETLRNSGLYKRLLEFEKNISEGKKFSRADLEF